MPRWSSSAGGVNDIGLSGQLALERDDDSKNHVVAANNTSLVNDRLQCLTNRRWLTPWQRRGEDVWHPPLIEEVDQTGVDRHRIAEVINGQELAQIEDEVRRERAHLSVQSRCDPSVPMWSYQHLLIQRLQETVVEADSGYPLSVAQSHIADHHWSVGDNVQYCGETYTIAALTDRKISLESAQHGGFDLYLHGPEMTKLRPATSTKPAQDAQE